MPGVSVATECVPKVCHLTVSACAKCRIQKRGLFRFETETADLFVCFTDIARDFLQCDPHSPPFHWRPFSTVLVTPITNFPLSFRPMLSVNFIDEFALRSRYEFNVDAIKISHFVLLSVRDIALPRVIGIPSE